jgi:twinkle protein
MVIGLERNQQDEDEDKRNTTTVRILKNRYAGLTGAACYLKYDRVTGRMTEVAAPKDVDDDF